MNVSCLDQISDPEPIIYSKRYQIVFFAKYKSVIPVAVKFSGSAPLTEIRKINTLGNTCPNIVFNLCIGTMSRDEMLGWMKSRRSKFVDDVIYQKIQAQISILRKEYAGKVGPTLSEERKKMIKTVYDKKMKIINQFDNFGKYIDLLTSERYGGVMKLNFNIFILERIASPYTLNSLIGPDFHPFLTLDNFLSISFQLLSFIYNIRKLGISHEDFTSRNIWLQPILTNYKYLAYPVPTGAASVNNVYVNEDEKEEKKLVSWYLLLKDSFHFIIKVGDYGEAKQLVSPGEAKEGTYFTPKKVVNWCNDLLNLSNYLLDMHKKCAGCNDVLMSVVDHLKICSDINDISIDINPFDLSTFSDKYSSLPEDATSENIVTPDLYFDYRIVDQTFIEEIKNQEQLIGETRKRYSRQDEKDEEKEDEKNETSARRLKTNNYDDYRYY